MSKKIFIPALVRKANRVKKKSNKIYLILDNASYHKSAALLDHIEKNHKGLLELVYLPSYSPELNPIELIWAHVKSHGINRILTKNRDVFKEAVDECLLKFTRDANLGRLVFGKKELSFIKEALLLTLVA